MIKKLFGNKASKKKGAQDDKELTIEDLITLERFDEAAEKLQSRLKLMPKDLHAHLKLAEVYVELKTVNKALDEYIFVADSYADDGFFDKAIALLSKAARLVPGDDMLPRRIAKYKRLKRSEHRRRLAIEGLMANETATGEGKTAGNSALEVELLWNKIARSHLVEQLDGEDLKRLFSVMELEHLPESTVLAEPGSTTPIIYLVIDGVIEAGADIGDKQMNIRSFSTGDLIGDSVLLERKSWPARYVVTESARVFKLTRAALEKTLQGNKDPVAFFSVLRRQQNDRDVAASLLRLRG